MEELAGVVQVEVNSPCYPLVQRSRGLVSLLVWLYLMRHVAQWIVVEQTGCPMACHTVLSLWYQEHVPDQSLHSPGNPVAKDLKFYSLKSQKETRQMASVIWAMREQVSSSHQVEPSLDEL